MPRPETQPATPPRRRLALAVGLSALGAAAACDEVDAASREARRVEPRLSAAPGAAFGPALGPDGPTAAQAAARASGVEAQAAQRLDLSLPGERRAWPALSEPTDVARGSGQRPAEVRPPAVDLVEVDVRAQRMRLWAGPDLVRTYAVSTASAGVGSAAGSHRTPPGRHRVCEKVGEGQPLGMVFEARRPTGRVARILTDPVDLPEDVITTRILRLEGLEPGRNKGPGVDSKARLIYIHGTNEEGLIGTPASHGCVRMRNADVLEVFELVGVGTLVEIVD